MAELDNKLKEYFKRSYFAVDGLWFMKVEEVYGFDTALELDERVWKVFPKIQSRKVRELLDIKGNGLKNLFKALEFKLTAEDYIYEMDKDEGVIEIESCPWIQLLKKSGRMHLCEKISGVICSTEYRVWAREFGEEIKFTQNNSECLEKGCCKLIFRV